MPLRDHFRSPLDDETAWEGFHGGWPMVLVLSLVRNLPRRYIAHPHFRSDSYLEIDIAAAQPEEQSVWTPPPPTLSVSTDLPSPDEYEVRVYDSKRGRRLVAAVEIVSPANKDRPEHRRAFVAKCAALLQQRVSVAIIDLVTTRNFNLYGDLLALIGQTDPSLAPEPPPLYAVAMRTTRSDESWLLEAWSHTLRLGQPLPTLPLWVADNLAIPLELEETYEETCRGLRIP